MGTTVKTVEQGVEGLLRLTRERYATDTILLSSLVPSTEDYHWAVIAELDDIIQEYTERVKPIAVPPSPTLEDWEKIPVGAKLGFSRTGTSHPYVKIDEDRYASPGYEDWARRIDQITPGDHKRGLHWEVDEIREGDTVRVTEDYPGHEMTGETFVVTGVHHVPWTTLDGQEFTFYVKGDRLQRGVWDRFIEKVEAGE